MGRSVRDHGAFAFRAPAQQQQPVSSACRGDGQPPRASEVGCLVVAQAAGAELEPEPESIAVAKADRQHPLRRPADYITGDERARIGREPGRYRPLARCAGQARHVVEHEVRGRFVQVSIQYRAARRPHTARQDGRPDAVRVSISH